MNADEGGILMKYTKAAQTADFTQEQKKKVTIGEKAILLVRVGDDYFAVDNACTHMGGSLYDGALEGYDVVCPRHGSAFDVRTGKLTKDGKLAFIKVKPAGLGSYPVKVEGEDILIGVE
jgi:3-phenylpropionate/trans-cinnamate dioxygenase ferredoxin subunit